MKFCILISFSLLISADLSFGKSRVWRLPTTTPNPTTTIDIEDLKYFQPTTDDITQTLTTTIARTLKEFRSHLYEWINNKISFNNEGPIVTSLTFEQDDYLVTFSNIYLEEQNVGDQPSNSQQITCNFSNNLKIQMPFNGRRLWIRGHVNLVHVNNTFPPQSNQFNVYLNGLTFSMTTKPNFNIGEILPNNHTEIDIDYISTNIDLVANRRTESVTMKALGSLADEIQSYLRSAIEEKLTTIIQEKISFLSLFTNCMHPKNEILRTQHLSSQEQNYYYAIAANTIEMGDSVKLNTDIIKIKGLSNFTDINTVYDDYNSPSFTMHISNLEGESGWNYESDGIGSKDFTPLKFTIDHVIIQGRNDNNGINDINLVTCPVIISSNSSDSAEALLNTILEKKLKNIITSSIANSLVETYRQV